MFQYMNCACSQIDLDINASVLAVVHYTRYVYLIFLTTLSNVFIKRELGLYYYFILIYSYFYLILLI